MKKRLLSISLFLLFSIPGFSQSYMVTWNSANVNYEIKQVNVVTNAVSHVGVSTLLSSIYDIDEIYFDKINNQIIALYQSTGLWKYNLNTHTDQVISLGSVAYRDFIYTDDKSFLIGWNSAATKYDLKQVNVQTGVTTSIGSSTKIASIYDIDEIYYDKTNAKIIALYQSTALWKFDLTTLTDQLVSMGSVVYRDFVFTDDKSFVIAWNSTSTKYELKQVNVNSGVVTNIGVSTLLGSIYDLDEIYYDKTNHQVISLFQSRDLWKYDLNTNTDQLAVLSATLYRDLEFTEASTNTAILDPVVFQKQDEIIHIYTENGMELNALETGRMLIVVYKSGITKKIFIESGKN